MVAEGIDGQEQMQAAAGKAAGKAGEDQELPSPSALHETAAWPEFSQGEKKRLCH